MYIKPDGGPQLRMPIFKATALWLVKWKRLNVPGPVTEADHTHYHESDLIAMMNGFGGAGTL
jgi:hypothetical protein